MSHENLVAQTEDHIQRLDRAVAQRNLEQIKQQTQRLSGMRNIMEGPPSITDLQRRMLRAIANEIDKLSKEEQEQLYGIADELRDLSNLGLR